MSWQSKLPQGEKSLPTMTKRRCLDVKGAEQARVDPERLRASSPCQISVRIALNRTESPDGKAPQHGDAAGAAMSRTTAFKASGGIDRLAKAMKAARQALSASARSRTIASKSRTSVLVDVGGWLPA